MRIRPRWCGTEEDTHGRLKAVPTAGTASDDILLPGQLIPSCAKQASFLHLPLLSDALDFCQVRGQFFLERYAVMRYYKSRRIVGGVRRKRRRRSALPGGGRTYTE